MKKYKKIYLYLNDLASNYIYIWIISKFLYLWARIIFIFYPNIREKFVLWETMPNLLPIIIPGDIICERYIIPNSYKNLVIHTLDVFLDEEEFKDIIETKEKYLIINFRKVNGEWMFEEIPLNEILEDYPESISKYFIFNLNKFISLKC